MSIHDRALDHMMTDLIHKAGCGCGRCRRRHLILRRRAGDRLEAGFPATRVDATVGTRAGPIALTEWLGWHRGVSLHDLIRIGNALDQILPQQKSAQAPGFAEMNRAWQTVAGTKAGKMPMPYLAYFMPELALYRISYIGRSSPAIDIGMVQSGAPGFRIMAHFAQGNPRSGLAKWSGRGRHLYRRLQLAGFTRGSDGTVRIPAAYKNIQVHLGRFSNPLLRWGRRDVRYMHVYESLLQRREMSRPAYQQIMGRRESGD